MKKHLIKGLLILAVGLVGVGSFSSCKDTNEDVWAKVEGEQATLKGKVDALEGTVSDLKQAQEACKLACEAKWEEIKLLLGQYAKQSDLDLTNAEVEALKQKIGELTTQYANLLNNYNIINNTVNNLTNTVNELQNKVDNIGSTTIIIGGTQISIQDAIAGVDAIARDALSKAEQALSDLNQAKLDIEALKTQVAQNTTTIENHTTLLNQLQTTINNINTTITNLTNRVSSLETTVNNMKPDVQKGVDAYTWIETNKGRLDALETSVGNLNNLVTQLQAKDTELENLINSVKTGLQSQIDDLKGRVSTLENKMTTVEGQVATLTTNLNTLTGRVDNIETQLGDFATRLSKVESDMTALAARVAQNEADIAALKAEMNKLMGLTDRLNKLVTGMILQGTCNPVFGCLNTPFGVRSNMLMTYYGYAETMYTFPSNSSAAEYNNEIVFTAKDIDMLRQSGNFTTFEVNPGDCMLDQNEGNAGMVYVTINPNNVDFTGVTLPIVNSQDEESGVKLSALAKSDEVLKFGYNVRSANNGFYEARATLSEADIEKVKVNIEPELKTAMKNALKDRKQNDFVALLKVLYDQFNGILPANGLKAAWTASDGAGSTKEYAVYSDYNLAATAIKPLSFKFLAGQTLPKLPTITPISNFEFDMSKFNFDITVPTLNVNGVELKFSLEKVDISYDGDIDVWIDVPQFDADGHFTGYVKTLVHPTKESIDDFIKSIEDSFNSKIDVWNEQIKTSFRNAMNELVADINKQVEEMVKNVAGQINDNLKDLVDEINKEINDQLGGYINSANNWIKRYNNAANRINHYLENPNSLLQVMMCYKGADGGFYQLSNSKAMPTPLVLSGGNAINLLTTTYSGEIVAPVYKKFVAVTNVWDAAGNSAQDGNATCLSLLKAANNVSLMNQPITGKTHRVAFSANTAGYTYEIVYSALDYHGYTSTRKYYVTIK